MADNNYSAYGIFEQRDISNLSDAIFNSIASDPKEGVMRVITDMCTYLEHLHTLATYVKKDKIARFSGEKQLRDAYFDARKRMNYIADSLSDYQANLLKSLHMLEGYELMNRTYSLRIQGAISKGEQILSTTDKNAFNSRQDYETLSARLDDIRTSQQVSNQLSVQIHMMLNEQRAILSGVTEILNNTISVWENRIIVKLERSQGLPDLDEENNKLLEQFKNILKIGK